MSVQSDGIMGPTSVEDMLRVAHTGAHFLSVACAGETCETCNRPLWQHIATPLARVCPTDGQPYWRMVWAIFRYEGLSDIEILREIEGIQGA